MRLQMKTNTIFENENITIRKNIEKHGIEVLFPSRPSEFERQLLKDSGFRWSNPQKLWWSRENDLTEKYIENEIERQNGLKKIKDWEEFKNESNERLEQEIQQTDIFSPESFLAGFNQDVQKLFDNNQFVDYDVNNNSTTSLQHGVKEELSDEGNETSGNKGSKSEEPYGNVGRGSSESNAEQFIDRSSSEMGGDSGSRYRGTGYRDDIREHETGWNSNASSSDYSSLSSGQIPGTSEQTDSKTGDGLRVQNLHKREVDNGISENNGSDEQSGHGDERSNGLSETPEEENSVLNNLNKNSNPWFEKLSESQKEAVLSDMKINPDLIGEYHTELSENNILFNEYNKPTEEWLLRKINYKNHEGEFSYFNENNAGQKKHYEEVFSEYKSEHKTLSRTESKDIRKEVKELLHSHSDEEIKSNAKWLNLLSMYEGGGGLKEQDSTSAEALNAFYTPRNVVEAVWKLADTYAPNARTVLEPSSGIGRFAENRPNNNFTLRELDETSARIARILYPDADVIQGAFQAQFFDDEGVVRNKNYELPKYDLVIGNPPYGEYTGEWKGKGEGKEFNRYEEYFIAKGLDSLKDENSVLAFVVPSGFLNSSNDKIKKLIAEKGELIDAYRLPEGTFPTTKVGTDIIVMRNWEKRHKDIIELNKAAPEPFKKNPDEELQKAKENMAGVLSNGDYFEFHTDKVLGEIKTRTNRFGKEEQYVTVHEDLTVQDELNKIELMLPYFDRQMTAEKKQKRNQSNLPVENISKVFAEIYKDSPETAAEATQKFTNALKEMDFHKLGHFILWGVAGSHEISEQVKSATKKIFESYTGKTFPSFENIDNENEKLALKELWFAKNTNVSNIDTWNKYYDLHSEQDVLEYLVSRGSGTEHGKERINDFFEKNTNEQERIKFLINEYNWYSSYTGIFFMECKNDSKGIKVKAYITNPETEEITKYEKLVSWKNICNEIKRQRLLEIYLDKQIEKTVSEETNKSQSKEIPETKTSHVKKEKSHIEKALEKYMNSENDISTDENVRKLLGIRGDFEVKDFKTWSDRTWRASSGKWDWTPHFDVDTKQVLITTTVENAKTEEKETKLYAVLYPDGNVKKLYDEYSDEFASLKLSMAKQQRLNDIINHFNFNWQPVMDGFLGMKDNKAYFATTQRGVSSEISEAKYSSWRDELKVFSSVSLQEIKTRNPFNAVLVDNNYNENDYDTSSRRNDDYSEIPVFAKLQTLFPKDDNVNLSNIDDDNAMAHLAGDEIDIPEEKSFYSDFGGWGGSDSDERWEKYLEYGRKRDEKIKERWNAALNEVVKASGCSTKDEYFNKAETLIKERHQKKLAALEEKTKIRQQEEDADIVLNEVLKNPLVPGIKEYSVAGYAILYSQNKDDHEAVDVLIDGNKCLTLNKNANLVTTYNNYFVTSNFIKNVSDLWEKIPSVRNVEVEDVKLSLNKLLEGKHFSQKSIEEGSAVSNAVLHMEKDQNETVLKTAQASYSIKKSGTIQKVFAEKSNYPLFEFNNKTNILKFYQNSYEKGFGFISGAEDVFKQTFEKLSVIKDITINGSRYIDVDGNTIEAPAKSERYTPVKEKIMDNAEFANTYGKNWNKEERAFWAATDYKGYVDLSKLTQEERKILETSPNYCIDPYIAADGTLVGGNKYIHKELYASGNIYKKLDLIEKLHNKSDMAERVYQKNKAILEAALPVPLKLDELELSVNSPFIRNFKLSGEAITERFIKWATGYDLEDSQNNRDQISDYSSAGISREDIPSTITWEDVTNYIDGIALPAIRDDSLDEKEKSQIRNRKINDRQETAEKLFTRYIRTVLTEEEGKSLSDAYNRQFNGSRDPDYAKLPLFIDGMNLYRKGSHFHLYEQQIKGISFLCNKGNGILAYDVGVGKTAAGIVATVQQIQSGRSKRPLVIVPKSVIGKWESDIHELFPDIPVNNLENFSRSSTGAFYNKANHGLNIPAGSITLTTKEALNNIHWNKATVDKYLFNDYADLLGLTEKLHSDNPKARAEAREKIYEEVSGNVRDEDYVEWINTGFDHVTVDEAHAYKKLERKPRTSKDNDGKERISEFNRIVGSGEPSGIAKDMFNITQIIQQQNENRNVFMLTATPFTNSPLEVYSMLVYVARKEMENCGIKNLNDFCSQYAKVRFENVVKPNGNVEKATVMKEWGDLHGLQNILKQYIDKVDGEEAGIIRPEKKTHKVNLEATELQKQIFEFAINEVMTYRPDKNAGEKGVPVLESMNMMRTTCLSPALLKQEKLVNPNTKEPLNIKLPPIEQIVDCSPKLKLVCDTVVSNWKKHQDCGQIIYMPEGTDSYPYVIDYMVKQGVPREVFASIDGQSAKIGGKNVKIGKEDDTDDVRAKVADAFNDKKNPCKILIGSAAISEGMDLNGNSVALYNTMMGWNPTECIQVEGRIWRQGNQQGHVHIVYPLIYDSIDSLLFQKHDEKDSRINQLFNYKGNTLNVADLDPEKLKYELIKDPTVRAKMQIDDVAAGLKNELLMLDSRLSDYDSLVESKIRFTEKLSEKESSKQNYIENHAKSVANGNPNRSEEEQKAALERFDKSINDIKKQIENIRRKYAEMGIENDSDKTEYVNKINVAKQKKQEELNKLYGEENFQKVVNSMKKDIADEKAREFENALLNPLDKTIQEDMLPFHVVERSVKEARYREAMRKSQNNELEQNALTEQFNEYLSEYEKKWGSGVKEEAKNNISQPTVSKSEPVAQKSETKTSEEENIIHVINQEIEVFDNKRDEEAQSQGMLFASEEPAVITRALNNTHVDWRNSNCSNFSENLSEVFRLNKKDITKEAVMKVAGKLIAAMPKDEKEKFIKLTSQMNIKGKTETSKFLIKVAKGELKLQPGKKPPVVQKNQENVEYDIF